MQLVWCDGTDSFNTAAADQVLESLAGKPDLTVALPTGRTPLGLYSLLRARAARDRAVFSRARWFDLDEYLGLGADHPLSYARFLREHLLDGIGARESQIRLLRGDAPEPVMECQSYDDAIAAAGGIDLAILGLGANGHIAFNEPGSSWERTTHVAELAAQTRSVNSEIANDPVPSSGLTMGIGTLRQARRILLLVSGESKREALRALRLGIPDRHWPVTSLSGHPCLTVIADRRLDSTGL